MTERPTAIPDPDALLSVPDVAELLGVPRKALLIWRSKGRGPASFRVGRFVRYRRQDVSEWVSERVRANEARPRRVDRKQTSDQLHP